MSGKTKRPSVSFVIVSYNCADLLVDCVKSVLQFGEGNIIVIDNASTDTTRESLLPFADKIKLLLNDRNLGYTIACNQGIRAAEADYIFLLNPDAFLKDESWKKLIDMLESDPSVGAIAPNLYYPDGGIQNYIRRFPTITALVVEFFVPAKWWTRFNSYRSYTCMDLDLSKVQPLDQPAGAALLFRSNYQMDERFFIYGSDLELCQRIWKDGRKILLEPSAAVFHHQSKGGTGSGNSAVRMWLQLDALYGYGLYFKQYRGAAYYSAYRTIVGFCLGIVAMQYWLLRKPARKIKRARFTGFLFNRNFRHFNV